MGRNRFGTLSSREIRRMNEREERRQQNKQAVEAFWKLSPEERQRRINDDNTLSRIQKNGITIDDLDNAAQEGYRDGAKVGAENTFKNIYAAIALVMKEKHGFGKKRIRELLNAIDEKVMYALDSKEMVQKVWEEIGLQMSFSGDTFDERIQEKEST